MAVISVADSRVRQSESGSIRDRLQTVAVNASPARIAAKGQGLGAREARGMVIPAP